MTITPTEVKEFTFVKNATTVIKKYTTSIIYSIVVKKGDVFFNLTSLEFDDFVDAINDADTKTYTDPV